MENPDFSKQYDILMNKPANVIADEFDAIYNGMQGEQTPGGAVENQPLDGGEAMGDVWINTFIRSSNWKPGKQGFNIDGRTGNAEFNNVTVRGTVAASNIIGSTITGGSITGVDFTGTTFTGATITGGTIQTAATGFRMMMDGAANSYKFLYNDLLLAELLSTSVLGSDTGGAALRTYGGAVELATTYQASTDESIVFQSVGAGVSFGIVYSAFYGASQIMAFGLPTASAGLEVGTIWNDAGTLKIVI